MTYQQLWIASYKEVMKGISRGCGLTLPVFGMSIVVINIPGSLRGLFQEGDRVYSIIPIWNHQDPFEPMGGIRTTLDYMGLIAYNMDESRPFRTKKD